MVEEFFTSLMDRPWGQRVMVTLFGFFMIIALTAAVAVPIANAVRSNDLKRIDEKISDINQKFTSEEEKEDLKIQAVCDTLNLQVDRIIERLDKLEYNLTHRIERLESNGD